MYSGHMIDELTQIVAQAEEHARTMKAEAEAEPQAYEFYASPYVYDGSTQQVLAGVA